MTAAIEAGEVVTLPQRQHHCRRYCSDSTSERAHLPVRPGESWTTSFTVDDDELIGAFLDMVENHKMIVENSGLLTVAALPSAELHGQEGRIHLKRRQHGCDHHVFRCSAWPDPERQNLLPFPSCFRTSRVNWYVLHPSLQKTRATSSNWITISLSAPTVTRQWNLSVTLEAYGTEHKNKIVQALEKAGCRPKVIRASL